MSTGAPLKYCIEGFQLTRVSDALKAIGMRQADRNLVTEANVLVVVFPTLDTERLLIDVAVEMNMRVLVISAYWTVRSTEEHFISVEDFERAMQAEAPKAVPA